VPSTRKKRTHTNTHMKMPHSSHSVRSLQLGRQKGQGQGNLTTKIKSSKKVKVIGGVLLQSSSTQRLKLNKPRRKYKHKGGRKVKTNGREGGKEGRNGRREEEPSVQLLRYLKKLERYNGISSSTITQDEYVQNDYQYHNSSQGFIINSIGSASTCRNRSMRNASRNINSYCVADPNTVSDPLATTSASVTMARNSTFNNLFDVVYTFEEGKHLNHIMK